MSTYHEHADSAGRTFTLEELTAMPDLLDCGHPPTPRQPGDIGTGYGTDSAGKTACYACCAVNDRAAMIADGRAVLYLALRTVPADFSDTDGRPLEETATIRANPGATVARWFVINWPGSLSFKCFPGVKRSPHGGGFGAQRIDAYFPGPDGYVWHAVNRGDSQIARCRRTRDRVQVLTATLTPVRLEVARVRNGRPGYVWTEGYKVTCPDGVELQPYMRKREAVAFCKAQGWRVRVAS